MLSSEYLGYRERVEQVERSKKRKENKERGGK